MVKVTIDNIHIDVPDGSTVLQACELAGVEVPRFCYHERLSIAGNCRMCLVQINSSPRLTASCGFPIADGMSIQTDTEIVRNARRATMEFLLINHPLDCPICDQGGECDLQDQAFGYGRDTSRYYEPKRAIKSKDFGPLIQTAMTRCIQCTRCVRFMAEIAGVPELGAFFRGEDTEISTYVEKGLSSELSGNLIDICPVGALTSKPNAYVARSWEMNKTDTIDVHDALGTNIQAHARGPEILRIVPKINDEVNESWLADKGRFAIDGLKYKRIDKPWVRVQGQLVEASWQEAFGKIQRRIEGLVGYRIGAIAGDICDLESLFALRSILRSLDSINLDSSQDGAKYDLTDRSYYTFSSGVFKIEQTDAILLIGTFPRHESPVLNARIRKQFLKQGGIPIGVIGSLPADLTYPVTDLGDSPKVLNQMLNGNHDFVKILASVDHPMIIIGHGALSHPDSYTIQSSAWQLARLCGAITNKWFGYNILHYSASRVGALDIGFAPTDNSCNIAQMIDGQQVDVIWALGADEANLHRIHPDQFLIYQGHHGEQATCRADVILPGATYLEKPGTWINTEGRVQRSSRSVFPPGDAREDWRIIRAFSEFIGRTLSFNTLTELRGKITEHNPLLGIIGELETQDYYRLASLPGPKSGGEITSSPLRPIIQDYYQTNVICRASRVMAECSRKHLNMPSFEEGHK